MLTTVLRRLVVGEKGPFRFEAYRNNVDYTQVPPGLGLYIHIPFCTTLCSFCPYNKIKYNPNTAHRYKHALLKEAVLLKQHLPKQPVSSLYIGGGTPTLMLEELAEVIAFLNREVGIAGPIGIEVHPREAIPEKLAQIKAVGISMVSLGIQTFSASRLEELGRNYTGADAKAALSAVMEANFSCVDADIMFNLPNQSEKEIREDLVTCYQAGVHQVSVYPLIAFPMTDLPAKIKREKMKRFSNREEYRLLKTIDNLSREYGYQRTSVWTYGKPGSRKYTSVTRESFIGLGAGATSQFANYFYLNTFDVAAYINRVEKDTLPINLVNTMSRRENMAYWLFWRCYEGKIDCTRFQERFGSSLESEFPWLVKALHWARLAKLQGHSLELTDLGAYLYHLLEKHYSLTYLNDMWAASMAQPWHDSINL